MRIASVACLLGVMTAGALEAQVNSPEPMDRQVQMIMQARPPEAEVAARDLLRRIDSSFRFVRAPGVATPPPQASVTVNGGAAPPCCFYETRVLGGGGPAVIMIDGLKLMGDTTARQNPSVAIRDLRREDIESVEVLKGTAAALQYGPDAITGVILVTTKEKKGALGGIRMTGGAFGTVARGNGSIVAVLDSLKVLAPEDYWQEVAILATQRGMIDEVARRDTARADLIQRMFSNEFATRRLRRMHRTADEPGRARIRSDVMLAVNIHYDLETELMKREVDDATLRLSLINGALKKRPDERYERVTKAVDDILGGNGRP